MGSTVKVELHRAFDHAFCYGCCLESRISQVLDFCDVQKKFVTCIGFAFSSKVDLDSPLPVAQTWWWL